MNLKTSNQLNCFSPHLGYRNWWLLLESPGKMSIFETFFGVRRRSCSIPIYNPCSDLKPLLPPFVIPAPIWNLLGLIWNPCPICNPFARLKILKAAPYFVISSWWNLVWDLFSVISKNDLGFNRFNPSHWWHHHLVLFWYWNPDMNNSWLSRSILMKLCQRNFWYDS